MGKIIGIIAFLIVLVIIFINAGRKSGISGAEQTATIIKAGGGELNQILQTLQGGA